MCPISQFKGKHIIVSIVAVDVLANLFLFVLTLTTRSVCAFVKAWNNYIFCTLGGGIIIFVFQVSQSDEQPVRKALMKMSLAALESLAESFNDDDGVRVKVLKVAEDDPRSAVSQLGELLWESSPPMDERVDMSRKDNPHLCLRMNLISSLDESKASCTQFQRWKSS